MIYIII